MGRLATRTPPLPNRQEALARDEIIALELELLWKQMQSLGFRIGDGGTWAADAPILPMYRRWADETARLLRRNGFPNANGDGIDAAWRRWNAAERSGLFRKADLVVQAELVASTLEALPDILTGKRRVTDILFPNSSMAKVEGIYKNNPQADYFNAVLAQCVTAIVEARRAEGYSAPLRILEVGAGTGGTSEIVLAALAPFHDDVEVYAYTDVSRAFLLHGEDAYGKGRPYLRYRLFDIQQPPQRQDVEIGTYDIVIAANVLHATKNMRTTVRNAKAVLKRNGVLLVNEIVANNLFAHLTFGLTEGWWLAEDPELRIEGCPALSVEGWTDLLTVEGFDRVRWPASAGQDLGQQIIMARSDGVVREAVAVPAPAPVREERVPSRAAAANDSLPDDALVDQVRRTIAEQLSANLRVPVEQISYKNSFSDYGVDSITGVKLIHRLNEALGAALETTHLYDYSSIERLADHIVAGSGADLRARWSQPSSPARPAAVPAPLPVNEIPPRPDAESKGFSYQPIAIIGMSGRFGRADDLDSLWAHLANGDDLVEPVTRWPLPEKTAAGDAFCRHGGFLNDIDRFDAMFFNISVTEATTMDPQQRIFMEEAWKALEDGGYAGDALNASRCGVYVGYNGTDYQTLLDDTSPAQAMWGNAGSILSARIAYYLNLQGPAITVDTACSSALVATHVACQGLWTHETDIALAGAAFVQSTAGFYLLAGTAGMLSSSGRCHTFDARADGFVPGEGVGVVLLKRLRDAVADGDHVYAIIRGSGINQDGTTNGITAPSALSQERLQRHVYETFGIHPETIQLVEAHGTATKLGDPVEHRALTTAFRKDTAKRGYCAIGSIKTNLGHTAAAAGMAGLVKLLLALRHRQLPPSIHYTDANPAIRFDESPFFVNTELRDWNVEPGQKRRAAVSAFGFSGTNAHVVVEEPGEVHRVHVARPAYLFVTSARTPEQLQQLVRNLVGYFKIRPDADLGNVCFTLMVGRKHVGHRLACTPRTAAELVETLSAWLEGGSAPGVLTGVVKDNENREQPSLKRYGQRCILESQRGDISEREYRENLEALADLFVQGYGLAYPDIFANGNFSRLSLPTYPFQGGRYWLKSRGRAPAPAAHVPADVTTVLAEPIWEIRAGGEGGKTPRDFGAHRIVLLGDISASTRLAVQARLPEADCVAMAMPEGALAERYEAAVLEVLRHVNAILEEKSARPALLQVLVAAPAEDGACFFGLSGLLKTAHRENPKFVGQYIDAGDARDVDALHGAIVDGWRDAEAVEVRYRAGQRQVKRLNRLAVVGERGAPKSPWRDGGVYLITGGLGGLGYIFATAIAAGTRGAKLVLVNRSNPEGEQRARLEALRKLGASVEYRQVDVGDASSVHALVRDVRANHGAITGIVHSAGVTRDAFILKKTSREVHDVLRSKVAGLVALDEATRDVPLEHFVCFSALAGVYGNPGQADYAAANAFVDAYAAHRHELVARGLRHGETLAIAWPLWAEGGMKMNDAVKAYLLETGLGELRTEDGLAACYEAMARRARQVVVLHGEPQKLAGFIGRSSAPASVPAQRSAAPAADVVDRGALCVRTVVKLKELLAAVTNIDSSLIDAAASFESFGIDSIMITQLNQALERVCGEISKTLFYEYGSLGAVAQHLVDAYPEACARWGGVSAASPPAEAATESRHAPADVREEPVPPLQTPADVRDAKVAIIGLAGRYPQADTLDAFWENLRDGKDCITEIPSERWPLENFYDRDAECTPSNGKSYSKWGGFLERFADFDPLFFGISPREAESMDPQERLFVEICWEVLEDAGYTRGSLQARHGGRVGVYAGITKTGFDLYGPALWARGEDAYPHTSFSSLTNRVSYLFNFNGPSIPFDTMCSASLTAIHEACEHLKRDECELAIAGGVNLYLHPSNYVVLCSQHMLSPDGKCRTFGAGANGYVPGEGVGAILLKLLHRAEADGDHVYGIVEGSAINHGGRTHGYTVPNPNAQAELIAKALRRAGIDARAVSYIEAHGTGTELGDPIEVAGLTRAFQASTGAPLVQTCALGSVKTNIGHCESAAGIAGVTKVLLQMKHGQLVPSLHARTPNPNLDLRRSPFKVQHELEAWHGARIAGVSSFGAGGANAHVVLRAYTSREEEPSFAVDDAHPVIIVLSSHTEEQLRTQARNLVRTARAQGRTDRDLPRIAWTLQTGREAMPERLAFTASSLESMIATLQSFLDEPASVKGIYRGSAGKDRRLAAFASNDEMREVVEKWIERRRYGQLLELWVQGWDMDWDRLYPGRKPRRISLPTYPFARDRYWVPRVEETRVSAAAAPVEALGELAEYEEFWEREEGSDVRDGELPKRWLVVTDDGALGASLEKAHGIEVIRGTPLEGLPKGAAYGVVYGAGQGLERQRGIHGLLRAARTAGVELRRLVLLGDIRNSYDATLIGIERSLEIVEPQLKVSAVYGDGELPSAEQVSRELNGRGVVRYAQGARYRLSYREAPAAEGTTPLREQGAYLITGGSGGLGSLFAEHLAKEYRARLALVGRRELDEAIERQLESLRARGATEAVYYRADVGNASEVDVLISKVEASWGSLQGIVHAAGLEARGTVYEKEWAGYAETLRSKVEGTRHLDERTSKHELDFVSYFSSTAAVLGDGGSCDYASGNRYQMAYAHQREELRSRGERSGKTVAVCWPIWRSGGMGAIGGERLEMYLRSSGQRYLEKDEGIRAWERALRGPGPVRVVLAAQPQRAQAFLSRIYRGTEAPAPVVAPSKEALQERIAADLKSRIETVLKIPVARIRNDANFADIGFDSIGLAQFARLLGSHYGIDVQPSVFFSYSTVDKLTAHFLGEHRDALERHHGSAASAPRTVTAVEVPAPAQTAQPVQSAQPAAPQTEEHVAIIGMSARVAGADDLDELWQALLSGKSQVDEIPSERWDWHPYYRAHGAADNRITTNKGGFIRDLNEFDPLFFEISPREAQWMDPRQQLVLQEAWSAFEDAGYAGERLRGTDCGVFIGVEEGAPGQTGAQGLATSNHNAILAARISYLLDLRGPNLAINTACSSSLVAVHTACQSIQRGECSMALVGGVNVLTSPAVYVALTESGMLSVDGECYTFDQRANGMVPGEAVVAAVLKSVSRAIADGDAIYGVIKGSGVNYDGRTNGITAPSGLSQTNLLEQIYQRHGIDAGDIGYVIAHGTGTKLGDPVEVNGLMDVFEKYTDVRGFCALGSFKPNFGHTFAASGLVSLVALLLSMQHRQIPPSANHERNNEFFDLEKGPFYIAKEPRPWDVQGAKKRVGTVSAFGMSGTNVHIVVEQYTDDRTASPPVSADEVFFVPLSARRPKALKVYAEKLLQFLNGPEKPDLARIARTLQVGRETMKHRAVFCVRQLDELATKLRAYLAGGTDDREADARATRWARGEIVDWGSAKLTTLRVPTYPFRGPKRSATPENGKSQKPTRSHATADAPRALHPMIHEKVSA